MRDVFNFVKDKVESYASVSKIKTTLLTRIPNSSECEAIGTTWLYTTMSALQELWDFYNTRQLDIEERDRRLGEINSRIREEEEQRGYSYTESEYDMVMENSQK
jgi:hypothetical protein